jgi:phage tail sheath protein FI
LTAGIHYLKNGSTLQYIRISDGSEANAVGTLNDDGTEATFLSTVDLSPTVDLSTNKFVSIDVDNAGPVTIDLSAGAGNPAAVTRTEILANLTTAFPTELTIAASESPTVGSISLTTVSAGATAEIEFVEPPGTTATAAEVDSVAETYNLQFLVAPQITLDVDNSGNQNFSFAFAPDVVTGINSETFNFTGGGQTLSFDVVLPGQTTPTATQTVTFLVGDFVAPAAATALEVATAINNRAIGISAADVGGVVVLTSDLEGTNAAISGVAGTAATLLGLPATGAGAGGDAADATAVTAAEVAAKLTATITGATAADASGVVTVTSSTTGSTSEVDVITGGGVFATGVTNGLDLSPPLDATLSVFGINVTPPNLPVTVNGTGPFSTVDITALHPGTFGDRISVATEAGTTAGTANYTVLLDGFEVERFNNTANADLATLESSFVTMADNGASAEPPTPQLVALTGGDDGITALTAGDYIGAKLPGNVITGLQLLGNPEITDVNIIAAPAVDDGAVIAAMDSLCQGRGDCMFLADPPSGLDVTEVINWHNGVGYPHSAFNTSYGATYWSWVSWYDNYSQETILEPPSGFLAAIMAFTDNNAEPWFAPAGLTRGRIVEGLGVEHSPDQGERDFLYGNGNAVNPIVDSINFGVFVRGQRTLQRSPTALDRVNVRRLLLVLRKVVATAIARLEFEPNDVTTRNRFISIVRPFMENVVSRRGIEDFSIICDDSTNPPAVVNRNELRGKILLKPVKAAEIIVVEFTLLAAGATFSEALA